MSFSTLGLADEIVRAVTERGYSVPTPIQMQAIPAVLSGGDRLASAQTGTGRRQPAAPLAGIAELCPRQGGWATSFTRLPSYSFINNYELCNDET